MAKALRRLERPPALHWSIQDTIKTYIRENDLRAGDPLPPETELARQLGISRNSVREAVKALETLGILETRRGNGVYVAEFSFEPLLEHLPYGLVSDLGKLGELFEVRGVLEMGMIERAVASMTEEHLEGLQHIVERMREKAEQGKTFAAEDREFHRVLLEPLGNETTIRLLDIFWLVFRNASEKANITDLDPMRTYRAHRAIVEALVARDVGLVRQALDDHYAGLRERLASAQRSRTEHHST
jgi:DNA-binding FadR family transcriptional regulator